MRHGVMFAASLALLAAAGAGVASASAPPPAPLWTADGGGVSPTRGAVGPEVPCQLVTVSLRLHKGASPPPPELHGKPSACQATSIYLGYLRGTLFIEGLDAAGARLFVATGLNPLHQDVEAPPAPGATGAQWRASDASAPVLSTTIRAPLTPSLSRLRWYDVDEYGQPRLVGETSWKIAPAAKP